MTDNIDRMKPVIAGAVQPEQMDRLAIMILALRHGFTLRPQEGRPDDLNEYVYAFAREVFEAGRKAGSAELRAERDALAAKLAELEEENSTLSDVLDVANKELERLVNAEPVHARLLEALNYAIKQVPELGTVPGVSAAIAAAEARGVTGPKRLTYEEIMQAVRHISFNEMTAFNIARAIEAAVLGVAASKNGD